MLKCWFVLMGVISIIVITGFNDGESEKYSYPNLFNFPPIPENIDNPPTVDGVLLGRHLFYDTLLSRDYSMSCSSCHKQKFAFADTTKKNTGVNGDELQRNTPPLFNLIWYDFLFWDGRATSLEQQIFEPVRSHKELDVNWTLVEQRVNQSKKYRTMFSNAFGIQKIDSVLIAKAIAQFEKTIISYRSKYDRVIQGKAVFTKDEYEGFIIANDQSMGNCLQCHNTDAHALGTNGLFSNNGLEDFRNVSDYPDPGRGGVTGKNTDIGKFKVPTLRNVALTAPYMHDGRFETLEEVLEFYSSEVQSPVNVDGKLLAAHSIQNQLSVEEQKKVISFLKTLTDSALVSDPKFSTPYNN